MLYKITALIAFLAASQLIPAVHANEACSIYVNNLAGPCEFTSRNQTECAEAREIIRKRFSCRSGFGDGCYAALSGCAPKSLSKKFKSQCKAIGGSVKTKEGRTAGTCVKNPKYGPYYYD